MSDQRVRIGVVGVGGMGQGHCKTIARVEDAVLTAVCDCVQERADTVAGDHDVPAFTSHADLIASGLCDAVLVATPHPVHPLVAIDAMRAGLHVLCEKPLSERIATAERMVAVAEETGVVFTVDFQRRTEPAFAVAAEKVRSGALGQLYRRTMISPEFRSQAYYDSGGWRATWQGEGGGVMMNQSPHILDLFILLGGMPSRVTGRVETRFHHIEVEDLAEAMLDYADGGTGYFTCSTCEAGPGQMIELFGEKGKLCYRNGKLQMWQFDPPVKEHALGTDQMWGAPKSHEVELTYPDGDKGHINIIRNFCAAILRDEPLVVTGREALNSLELANAVWLSAHTGQPVDLPLDREAYDRFLEEKRTTSTFVKAVSEQTETDPQHL